MSKKGVSGLLLIALIGGVVLAALGNIPAEGKERGGRWTRTTVPVTEGPEKTLPPWGLTPIMIGPAKHKMFLPVVEHDPGKGGLVLNDDFGGYDDNWEMIDDCDGGWERGAEDRNRTEGDYSQFWSVAGGGPYKGARKDFSAWADTDYFVMTAYRDYGENNYRVKFYDGSDYFFSPALTMAEYWQVLTCAKGDFSPNGGGSPSWSSIDQLYFSLAGAAGEMDNWRWSKKDPDASQPNDFGSSWDYFLSSCPWFVYTDVCERCAGNSVPVGSVSGPGEAEQVLLASMDDIQNIKMKVRVYAFTSSVVRTGRAGIVFRCSDGTSGSEDCYALVLDTDSDTLSLYKYVEGEARLIGEAGFNAGVEVWYWVGVEAYENKIACYASENEGDLWGVPLIEVTAPPEAGKCGLIVADGMGRFDNVDVWKDAKR